LDKKVGVFWVFIFFIQRFNMDSTVHGRWEADQLVKKA